MLRSTRLFAWMFAATGCCAANVFAEPARLAVASDVRLSRRGDNVSLTPLKGPSRSDQHCDRISLVLHGVRHRQEEAETVRIILRHGKSAGESLGTFTVMDSQSAGGRRVSFLVRTSPSGLILEALGKGRSIDLSFKRPRGKSDMNISAVELWCLQVDK